MKIIFENKNDEPITDLAIANCIRNYITENVLSVTKTIFVCGEEMTVYTGVEDRKINNRVRTIANLLLITASEDGGAGIKNENIYTYRNDILSYCR